MTVIGLAAAITAADPAVPVHDLYDEAGAEVYDHLVHATHELGPMLARLRTLPGDRPVLDLACGSGRVGLQLARRGRAVVGVDASAAMLDRYRRRLTAEPPEVAGRTALHTGDFHRLGEQFAPGSFRAAVLGATTIVLVDPGRRVDLFAAVHDLLVPGGAFLLDVPVLDARELRARPRRTTVFELAPGDRPAPRWAICLQDFDVAHHREIVNFVVDGVAGDRQVITTAKRIVFGADVIAELTKVGFTVEELPDDRAAAGGEAGAGRWLCATRPPGGEGRTRSPGGEGKDR